MTFRIADTFTSSLAKLEADEQKAVKTTAFDLQMNPASPGMQFHKLERAKDKNFWSVRVSRDIRLIVHRTDGNLLLCYVDHHDAAYRWAERRRLERHPQTGAAQLVEIRETVREIEIPKYVETEQPAPPKSPPLAGVPAERLLAYGVPEEWIADIQAADDDALLTLADHLPAEAAEAVLELATGGSPPLPVHAADESDPFTHPDAQRRFRVMEDAEELARALAFPWDRWTVFLHPTQRETVSRTYSGPARVMGSAGTGKTVVAIHRAAHLAASRPDAKVLLTTFSLTLARHLRDKLGRLVGPEPKNPVAVRAIDEVGLELYEQRFGKPQIPTASMLRTLLAAAQKAAGAERFSPRFLEAEWLDIVDAWQLADWDAYRTVPRLGRKTRLGEKQRAEAWGVFEHLRADLAERGFVTIPQVFAAVTEEVAAGRLRPADHVVIDEAQDITVPHLRFLAAVAGETEDGLFFAGDLGQRIFQTPFSWTALGVSVRGRSQVLRINYRTSHQIRRYADRLLPPEMADVDGNTQSRTGTVSAFNGPDPVVIECESTKAETERIAEWITARRDEGIEPHELAIFVRSDEQVTRASHAAQHADVESVRLDASTQPREGAVSIATMHLAKGLEFRGVAVIACDDEVIPLQSRIESVTDPSDLEEVYNTERHLLYVACTRARDHLLVTGVEPMSEFLDDLRGE